MEDVMSWSRTLALGVLLWPLGCVVSVSDDPDGFGGSGGTFDGESGEGGDDGLGGSAGSSGSSGSAGASSGGTGGTSNLPAPTCEAEQGDDECTQCLKAFCCDEWVACDDATCPNERDDVAECMLAEENADSDTLLECISDSSALDDGLVQENTTNLIECTTRSADDAGFETLCSSECYGVDIFFIQ
jgi:hypothetical protein